MEASSSVSQPCPLHLTFSSVAVHRGSRRSMPVSRFLSSGRDGAWRSGASGSGFLRSDSTNRPWLRSWNGKKISTDLNGLRDSEKAYRARVSIPERSSVYKVLVARKDRSYQQRCSGRPLRFLRVAVTTARCSAIGVCYIISGVLKPYVFFFFARPAYPHEKHRKIVFARLVFREMILYWLVPMTCETRSVGNGVSHSHLSSSLLSSFSFFASTKILIVITHPCTRRMLYFCHKFVYSEILYIVLHVLPRVTDFESRHLVIVRTKVTFQSREYLGGLLCVVWNNSYRPNISKFIINGLFLLPWSLCVQSISLYTLSLISSNSSVFITLSWVEQQWKRDRKGRKIYSSNTDSVKLSCSVEVRRRKVFSVCDGQRAPSVSPYLILQFDARAQEAFCALGKHVSAILQYVSIRGQKFHLPFNELARAAIDVHCLLFNRPFHWRVTSFPRLLALLHRRVLFHRISSPIVSFSFVLKQGYCENSLALGGEKH